MTLTEPELVGLALALGAAEVEPLSERERGDLGRARPVGVDRVAACRAAIERGEDPLGEAFTALRSRATRRVAGATYTPPAIVAAMIGWAGMRAPVRVVDPGAGSGRFAVAAGRAFPRAKIVAIELDPVAALLARAHLAASGLGSRAQVVVADYRDVSLARVAGPTLFVGNPPYVRHHGIDPAWKRWLVSEARTLGLDASKLAGLHAHFFLATALKATAGDYGVFITAAEWLDVNYGRFVRALVAGPLGGSAVHVIEPTALPFADADTTAAITCFEVGANRDTVAFRRVASIDTLAPLAGGRAARRDELALSSRWTPFTRAPRERREGFVELGELCRVHRGQVTGANDVWIAGAQSPPLPPEFLFAAVTKARELFAAAAMGELTETSALRRVIDIPADLDAIPSVPRAQVERFLSAARAMGADRGFVAEHRKAWWAVGLRPPAPILATYMARRPPAFVRNRASARHINIAHGLYPREPLAESVLDSLARYLASATSTEDGRTYAGGLTKFEPKEMERLLVPAPASLAGALGSRSQT